MRFLSKKWTAVFALFLAFFVCVQPVSASNQLTLYARWNTQVTFDANGGVLAGGTIPEEQALAGKASGTLTMSLNQAVSTGLIGSRTNFTYVGWNTQADGMGTWIENYGRITGPVTFYAIYYQSNYYYTGAPQTFRVPIDGWYEIQLWGAEGGDDAAGEGGRAVLPVLPAVHRRPQVPGADSVMAVLPRLMAAAEAAAGTEAALLPAVLLVEVMT